MQFLCVFFAVTLLAFPAYAERIPSYEEQIAALPPEMIYDGKPINPGCVYGANPFEGKPAAQDLKTCKEMTRDGDLGPRPVIHTNKDRLSHYFGYDWATENGNAGGGSFLYRYVGLTPEGIVLHTSFNGGGNGTGTKLSLFRRDDEHFQLARELAGGWDCGGSVDFQNIQVNGNDILYHRNADNHFIGKILGILKPKHFGDMPRRCLATVHMKNGSIRSIELVNTEDQLNEYATCAAQEYRKQVKAHGTKMTPDEARAFFRNVEKACATQDDLK